MAITAPTKLSDFSGFITPEMAAPIFERAARSSVVQQLSPQIPMGPSGVSIPFISARPTAAWVGEAAPKHKTSGGMDKHLVEPKKLTAIMVDSMEVVRANPGGYLEAMRNGIAEAFAIAFDRATLHDEGGDGTAAGGPFSTYIDQTTKTSEIGTSNAAAGSIHGDLVSALRSVVSDQDSTGRRYRLTGWAIDDVLEPSLWGALDTTGRPIYVDLPSDDMAAGLASPGRLLNRPSWMGEGVSTLNQTAVVGYGGDWSQTRWGVIGGISYRASQDTSVTIDGELVSCFENNLIAFLAEAEYGWVVKDPETFVKLTNVGNSPVTSS
jgi:HK97 family phage major capsid protein